MQLLEQISRTYAWYRGYGNTVESDAFAQYVKNTERPDIWVANQVSLVRASTEQAIEQVLARADRELAHCEHRMVLIDPLTPAAFTAQLALLDYRELSAVLQMVLTGPMAVASADTPPNIALRAITSDADWSTLYTLVRADHVEGKATRGMDLAEEITQGIVAEYRAKSQVSQFFLASSRGVACAYGQAIVGPYGMGIVEDLFVLPGYRKQGIARALIRHAVTYARERGMGPMLIGTHVNEAPKRLYAALGFAPQCLIREYLLETGTHGS
jgi:GNAT superfamily N-acetyltransferase